MFTEYDQVSAITEAVRATVLVERAKYAPYYAAIEQFISEHKLIVGGSMAVDLLAGLKVRGMEDFNYEVYVPGADTYQRANDLANTLAVDGTSDGYIVLLKTALAHQRFIIMVDGRPLVILMRLLGPSPDISPVDIIRPRQVTWFPSALHAVSEVLVLPPEMQLIDLYRTLYSPSMADDWAMALTTVGKLVTDWQHNAGGADKHKTKKTKFSRSPEETIQLELLRDYICDNDQIALVGFQALNLLSADSTHYKLPESRVLHVVSANKPEEDYAQIERLVRKLGNGQLQKTTRPLYVMQDSRIVRTVIKLEGRDLVYIYNAATYDLIPVIKFKHHFAKSKKHEANEANDNDPKSGKRGDNFTPRMMHIGNPFVVLRFLLLEIWILRWIMALGAIDKTFGERRLQDMMTAIMRGQKAIKPEHVFQDRAADYIGTYENEEIAQKTAAQGATVRHFADYIPQAYYAQNGSYRIVKSNK